MLLRHSYLFVVWLQFLRWIRNCQDTLTPRKRTIFSPTLFLSNGWKNFAIYPIQWIRNLIFLNGILFLEKEERNSRDSSMKCVQTNHLYHSYNNLFYCNAARVNRVYYTFILWFFTLEKVAWRDMAIWELSVLGILQTLHSNSQNRWFCNRNWWVKILNLRLSNVKINFKMWHSHSKL